MALVNCSKCKGKVSESASSCPHCHHIIYSQQISESSVDKEKKEPVKTITQVQGPGCCGCLFFIVILLIILKGCM